MEASRSTSRGEGGLLSPLKTMQGSRANSAPVIAAAYNLRQYCVDRGRLAPEPTPVESKPAPFVVTMVDLAGGNGRWRQQRAKEQWVLDQADAEQKKQEQRIIAAEKRRRKAEREAKRRRQQEEIEQRRRAAEEKQLRERLEREERERREAEERRRKELQEQADWLARQPKTCGVCKGSGKCTQCDGKGYSFSMFLAPSVGKETLMDYGRAQQGCPGCGGCEHNIVGSFKQGSGNCTNCGGVGKVTPTAGNAKFRLRSHMTRTFSTVKRSFSGAGDALGD